MATGANPHSILFTNGQYEPIWRTLSSCVHLIGVSVLSYCIACRTNRLSCRDLRSLPLNRCLVLLIFIDSWLFIFSAGLLISGVGLAFNSHSCSAGIFLCIVLYVTTKLLIYWFLVEKVHIVHPAYSRWKSRPYRICMLFIGGYFGVIIVMILGRIAFLRNGHQPASVNDSATDGACVIGLRPAASLSLLIYDLILNVLFTCMFLYPVYKSPNLSPRLKLIAKRTLIAAFIALLTSVVNICVLTVLHGKELGAICLGSCGLDTTVNALAVFAVTSPIEDNNSREPSPKQTDVVDVIRPKPILHSSIIGVSVGTGNGIGIGRGGGSGGGILETAPPEYRSANSNSNGNGNGNGTRSVHFPPEVTSRVQSSGMGGGNGNGSGNGIGTVTIIDMDADADADADGKAIVERRRRDEADRLERGWMGIRVGVGIGEDVIQPGIMDDFGPAAMGYIPAAVPAPAPVPASASASAASAVGGSRNGMTRTTNEVYPVIRPSNSLNPRTTTATANTTTNPTPAPASASPPVRQYRPRDGRGSGEIEMRTATTTMTSMTSIISSDYPRPGTPEETSVEIKHEAPSSLMAVTATKFRALSASASTRIKAKPKRLAWSTAATTNVVGPPSGPGDLINVNENALGNVVALEMRESNMAGGSGSGSGSLSSSLSGVLRQSPVPPSPSIVLTKSTAATATGATTTGTGTIDTEDGQLQERLPNAMIPLTLTETPNGSGGGSIGEGSSRNGSLRLGTAAAATTSNTPTTTTTPAAAVAGRTNGRPSSMSLEVSVTTRTDQIVEQVRRKKLRGLIEDYDGSQSSTRTRRSRSSTGGL